MKTQHRNSPCACGSKLRYKHCCGAIIHVPGTPDGPGSNRYGGSGRLETGTMLHILMPTRGTVTIETMMAVSTLGWQKDDYARLGISRATFLSMPRMGVAEARERLAEAAIRGMDVADNSEHMLLWIDDDAAFTANNIMTLLNEMRRSPDIGILSAFYSAKVKGHPGFVPRFPSIYSTAGHESALRVAGVDFEAHHVVEVPWVGLHCAIMRGKILSKLERPFFPFDPASGAGEDVGFSHRIRAAGYKCAVHAGVVVPHIDADTGTRYIPDLGLERLAETT